MDLPRRSPQWTWIAIAALSLAGIVLRWWGLGRESFWFDEGYTAWAAGLPLPRLFQVIRSDVSPPGYYLLLHFWAKAFGSSEVALRAMSALAATLGLGIFVLLARRVLGKGVAVVAATAFFAFSVMQIEYARDARFYTLITLGSLAGLYGLHVFMDQRESGRFCAGAFAMIVAAWTLNVYTHNLMLLYLVSFDLLWLVFPGKLPLQKRIADVLAANVCIAVLYAPWLGGLWAQLHRVSGEFWAAKPVARDLAETFTLLAGVKSSYPAPLLYKVWFLGRWSMETVRAVTLGIGVLSLLAALWRMRDRRSTRLLALTAYAVLPVLVVYVISRLPHTQSLFLDKVFIASSPILALVYASPLAWLVGRWQVPAAVVMAGLLCWMGLSIEGFWQNEHQENWRGVYQYVSRLPPQPRLILFVANEGEILLDYYAQQAGQPVFPGDKIGLPQGFFDVPIPRTTLRVFQDQDLGPLRKALASGRYTQVVYVRAHDWYSDPGHRVSDYLQWVLGPPREREFAPVVFVDEYAVPKQTPDATR